MNKEYSLYCPSEEELVKQKILSPATKTNDINDASKKKGKRRNNKKNNKKYNDTKVKSYKHK